MGVSSVFSPERLEWMMSSLPNAMQTNWRSAERGVNCGSFSLTLAQSQRVLELIRFE
jgi:hypothetical protein